jgi:hypothetical protein
MGRSLPSRSNFSGFLEPIKCRVKRALLEPQQAAAVELQPAEYFQAVGLAALQRGKD